MHLSYFGTDGEHIILANGFSQVVKEYNEGNAAVRVVFLDQEGRLVNCLAGYACMEQTVTEWGCTSKAVFYDKKERELFSYHVDFNEYGQKTEEWLAGPDGAYLNLPSWGVARIKYFYDDNRVREREEYYDEEGNPDHLFGFVSG